MESRKNSTDDPICRVAKETQNKEQTYGHSGGGGEWDDLRE